MIDYLISIIDLENKLNISGGIRIESIFAK